MNTGRDLKEYFPKTLKVGPYVYDVVIESLEKQEVHGLCNFEERKISIATELNFDLDKPNALYTLEVLLHECFHAFNYNSGLRSIDWRKMKHEDIEEEFVDHTARHFIQLICDNPSVIQLIYLFKR